MDQKIKRSVAILLAHIVKIDNRDVEKQIPLFCSLMGQNFECNQEEVAQFLRDIMLEEYDLDEHVDIIYNALKEDDLSKMHILEQLNHMIYSDTIAPYDYKLFEDIKKKLFPNVI